MSNDRYAYGWHGHILCSRQDYKDNPDHNLIAIPSLTFERLASDMEDGELDPRIEANQIGIGEVDRCGIIYFVATGHSFSVGYRFYGTVFEYAEDCLDPASSSIDRDAEYHQAMHDIYGLDLPPSGLMIGCFSEH